MTLDGVTLLCYTAFVPMEEELISKKELLEAMNISYGQFYRWKRKGLIPDKWLIHKSTRTGQESFLPADRILSRIEKIKELKEDNTLKEIADLLSPELVEKKFRKPGLVELEWVSSKLLDAYEEIVGSKEFYSFTDLVYLKVLFTLRESGESARNIYLTIKALNSRADNPNKFDEKIIIGKRKPNFSETDQKPVSDSGFCVIATGEVTFGPSTEAVNKVKIPELVQKLKLELREKGRLGLK